MMQAIGTSPQAIWEAVRAIPRGQVPWHRVEGVERTGGRMVNEAVVSLDELLWKRR